MSFIKVAGGPRLPLRTRSLQTSAHTVQTNAMVHVKHVTATKAGEGPLSGMKVAIKDNICTKDMPTTCSSEMLRDFTSPFDATVVSLLHQAGAHIVGKTNCDEFGMGSLNTHSIHGPVINPWKSLSSDITPRSAGGSSGGSAAAVAAGLCDVALGTDTGGSVRLPASYCGVVGLKPSYGLLSRWGVVSYSDSLDCVGILTRNTKDIADVFPVLNDYDAKDPTSIPLPVRAKASKLLSVHTFSRWNRDASYLSGLRIGIPQEYFPAEIQSSVVSPIRALFTELRGLGATLVPVSLPSTSYALSAYYVIASAEASSNLARFTGIEYGTHVGPPPEADLTKASRVYAHSRSNGFGREVQKRILLGTYALSADAFDNYFLQAQRVRKLVKRDFDHVFAVPNVLSSSPSEASSQSKVDVIMHPSAIRTAPPIDSGSESLDTYVQDTLTVPASLAGLPALSVPAGTADDGWPVGVSVVGQWGCDELVLRVGEIVQAVTAGRDSQSSSSD